MSGLHEFLRCPTCRASLNRQDSFLCCPCGRFPIVAGIPILQKGPLVEEAAHAIQKGAPEKALEILLRPPTIDLADRLLRIFKGRASEPETFEEAIRRLKPYRDRNYYWDRLRNRNVWAVAALFAPLSREDCVIDLGCGTGQLTRFLVDRVGHKRVVGIDSSFSSLYVARRFQIPDVSLVCSNLDEGLPIAAGWASAVTCVETLAYISRKDRFLKALEEIAPTALLAHIVTRRRPDYYHPIDPAELSRLLEKRSHRLYDQEGLVAKAVETREACLDGRDTVFGETFCAVIGERPHLYRRYPLWWIPSPTP